MREKRGTQIINQNTKTSKILNSQGLYSVCTVPLSSHCTSLILSDFYHFEHTDHCWSLPALQPLQLVEVLQGPFLPRNPEFFRCRIPPHGIPTFHSRSQHYQPRAAEYTASPIDWSTRLVGTPQTSSLLHTQHWPQILAGIQAWWIFGTACIFSSQKLVRGGKRPGAGFQSSLSP